MGQDDNSFFDFVGHDVQLHVSDSEKAANVASSVLEYSHSRHCDKIINWTNIALEASEHMPVEAL